MSVIFPTVRIDVKTRAANSKTERILVLKKCRMSSSLTATALRLEVAHSRPYAIDWMCDIWVLGLISDEISSNNVWCSSEHRKCSDDSDLKHWGLLAMTSLKLCWFKFDLIHVVFWSTKSFLVWKLLKNVYILVVLFRFNG